MYPRGHGLRAGETESNGGRADVILCSHASKQIANKLDKMN